MVIKDLDLEPKIDTMMRDFLEVKFSCESEDDSTATSIDKDTYLESTVPKENDFIKDFITGLELNSDVVEFPVSTIKRSSRHTKLSTSLNEIVVECKINYGGERVVNYSNLNLENFCFAFSLIKNVESTCYIDSILDNNLIDVINTEIEALNRNHTLDITDLLANRKPIGFSSRIWVVVSRHVSNPMEPNFVLSLTPTAIDPLLDSIIAQDMHTSLKSDLTCALNVLRYLKGSLDKGLSHQIRGADAKQNKKTMSPIVSKATVAIPSLEDKANVFSPVEYYYHIEAEEQKKIKEQLEGEARIQRSKIFVQNIGKKLPQSKT
ncbi:hypothetical protein Tco_0499771 [Tanacetum coccineum]